jgi:iron complex transport system permease protein
MNQKAVKWLITLSILLITLTGVCIIALTMGTMNISIDKLFWILLNQIDSTDYTILMQIRLPRILVGIAVGGALSLAGVILQAVFRNPLVEPYTLGISGGAALGVSISIVFSLNQSYALSLPFFGMIGAGCVILAIYSLNAFGVVQNVQRLLLIGVMISFISNSLFMLIISLSKSEQMHSIMFWTMGSLEEPNRILVYCLLIVSLLGCLITSMFSVDLNVLSLGEADAFHLGLHVERVRNLLLILASILTGFCVSISGIIGFVGLVVPHFVRLFFGSDHRTVVMASYITGAIFIILCDLLARTLISPLELPVGIVTGLVGGLIFIYALVKK